MAETDFNQLKKEECRWQILRMLDRQRPASMGLSLLQRALSRSNLVLTTSELSKELHYLEDKELISAVKEQWSLRAIGVEVLEGHYQPPPGVSITIRTANIEVERRLEIRWRILRSLDVGRPVPTSYQLLLRVMEDVQLSVSDNELERELAFLQEKGLVSYGNGMAEITAAGVDVCEYTTDAPPSVGRPEKYWED